MAARRWTRTTTLPALLCGTSLLLFAMSAWLRWSVRQESPAGEVGWLTDTVGMLGFIGIPVAGAVIASRLPENPYGWLWCAFGLVLAASSTTRPLVRVAGGPAWVEAVLSFWFFLAFLGFVVPVFLLFPTGRLPGPRWRWLLRAAVAVPPVVALATPFVQVDQESWSGTPWTVHGAAGLALSAVVIAGTYTLFVLGLLAMGSVLLRFRRAGPVERRQLEWFLCAALVNAALVVLDLLDSYPGGALGAVLDALAFGLLPVAVGVAVLRYRLYEIDRIISRTVSYAVLSAALLGLYVVVVTGLQALLRPLAGSSDLAVVVSTLVVAAVFGPARRRVQAGVDARFDRARYDAARAVERYAARLRSQVDLDEVVAGLGETVASTVGPSRVAVWVRDDPVRRGA